ncbi:MAG: hypothetical protein ABIT71_26595 [Vicinamibacteraceae bacterium]
MPSLGPVSRRLAPWKIMAGLTAAGLVLFLAGVGVVVATGTRFVRVPVDLSSADAEAAYAACQRFALAQLKAPGPVTFAPIGRWTVRRYTDGRMRVRSHADAANAAGRLVEIRVACRLRPLGGDRWDLESLTVSTD